MRVIRSSECRTIPWKNGGGETTEILVSPEGAGLDDFDWRVSMARVENDGPFSTFPGVDRTLAVLSGEGVSLTIGAEPSVALTRQTQPHGFAADSPTRARLLGGPITDLNVMVRRDTFARRVTRLRLDAPLSVSARARHALLFCAEGGVEIETPEGVATLAPSDALLGGGGDALWRLIPHPATLAYLIEILDLGAKADMPMDDE